MSVDLRARRARARTRSRARFSSGTPMSWRVRASSSVSRSTLRSSSETRSVVGAASRRRREPPRQGAGAHAPAAQAESGTRAERATWDELRLGWSRTGLGARWPLAAAWMAESDLTEAASRAGARRRASSSGSTTVRLAAPALELDAVGRAPRERGCRTGSGTRRDRDRSVRFCSPISAAAARA